MRLVALLALCGCNQVFGLKETASLDIDATVITIDAKRELRIDTLMPPIIVNTNDTFVLAPFILGPPNETALYSIETMVGSVEPAQGDVALDGNGVGKITTMYRAPAAPGNETITFSAADVEANATQSASFGVTDLVSIGLDMTTANSESIPANLALGGKFTVSATSSVKKLGLWTTAVATAGTQVKLGLYSYKSGGVPDVRFGVTAAATLAVGRNEFPLTAPVQIPPGDYYIVGVFDHAVTVPYITTGFWGEQQYDFPMAMMNPWSGSSGNWIGVLNKTHCFFMRAGQ